MKKICTTKTICFNFQLHIQEIYYQKKNYIEGNDFRAIWRINS
jgi:hypothetical protein